MKLHFPLLAATTAASLAEWPGGLIPLPRDYADLMNMAGEFTCKNSVTGKGKNKYDVWTPVLWIRIQIGSVFSSFVDPGPYSDYRSGSTQPQVPYN